MLLHITTHIEGRKHDDLLGTIAGRLAWPHLCVLDNDGSVLATHNGDRSAEGFAKTAGKAKDFVDLRTKAASGDAAAKIDYTLARAEMGQLTAAELKAALPGLGKLTPEQEKTLNGVLANALFEEIQKTAVGEKFADMLAKGMMPSDEQKLGTFWIQIMEYADFSKNADLYAQGLEGAKAIYGKNPQAAGFFKQKETRLAELKGEG